MNFTNFLSSRVLFSHKKRVWSDAANDMKTKAATRRSRKESPVANEPNSP